MNILHLISPSGLFGAEKVLLSLARQFHDGKDKATVGVIANRNRTERPLFERAAQIKLPTFVVPCDGRFDLQAVFRLKRFLQEDQVDILHSHNYKADVVGWLASRGTKTRCLATLHGYTAVSGAVMLYERLDRWLVGNCFDRYVTVTPAFSLGRASSKRKVIPNGIELEPFAPHPETRSRVRRHWGIRDADTVVGTVGRLSVEKNQKMLLKAAALVCVKQQNVKVLIAGSGPEEQALKELTGKLGLSARIIFTGNVEAVHEVYQAIDIFALTSLTEGLPLVIIEALAAHKAVVATQVGGVPQLIEEGMTGWLVEPGEVEALALKMEDLLAHPARGREMADRGYRLVREKYGIEKMVSSYRKVYQELLEA